MIPHKILDEIMSDRIDDRDEKVRERLDHIPQGQTLPSRESLTLHSAKEYRLGVVFIDINDFTGYANRNDTKDTLYMLNIFLPEAMELVRDHGGKLEKNTGDGILAYFGAGEDDIPSVHSTVCYIAAVKYLLANYVNPILEDNNMEQISISAGAAYGQVFVSRIGAHSGKQQMNRLTAVSPTANIASELEGRADDNEYLVDELVYKTAKQRGMWDEHMKKFGQLEDYYVTNDANEYISPQYYYNFHGVWEGTDKQNLIP